MKRNDVIKLLEQIEVSIPVDQWRFGDISIWPILKMDIFFQWIKVNNKNSDVSNSITYKSYARRVYNLLYSSFKYIALYLGPKKKIDIVYCGAASHRVDSDGAFINRYFQPQITRRQSDEYVQFEFEKPLEKKYPSREKIIFIEDLKLPYSFIKPFLKSKNLDLPEWNKFLSLIDNLDLPGIDLKNRIVNRLESIDSYAFLFKLLIRKYQPNEIFGLCYYSAPMFALNYVANTSKIPIYDMQHGGQGKLHPMYSFKNIPTHGYNTLPKTFLCWDKTSFSNLESWLKGQKYHTAEISGNPWIDFQIRKDNVESFSICQKKVILFTLQEDTLEPYILESIANTPENYQWWIRAHPRMKQAKSNIMHQLNERQISHNIEFDKAFEYPLPILLKNSVVHISKFSGSIIESALVNTPSIIIDEIGVEIYGDYITDGLAVSVLSKKSEDLLMAILNFK